MTTPTCPWCKQPVLKTEERVFAFQYAWHKKHYYLYMQAGQPPLEHGEIKELTRGKILTKEEWDERKRVLIAFKPIYTDS